MVIEVNVKETLVRFQDLEEGDQYEIVKAHAEAFQLKVMGKMEDIFRIGNPQLVIGSSKGQPYCRIHKNSIDIMKLLTKNYLATE